MSLYIHIYCTLACVPCSGSFLSACMQIENLSPGKVSDDSLEKSLSLIISTPIKNHKLTAGEDF